MQPEVRFRDRQDAGRRLADRLCSIPLPNPVVLALPRGGVPVACEIAHRLGAPLDLLFVRKLGAPGDEEFAIGAIVEGETPQVVLNTDAIATLRVTAAYVAQERDRQAHEIERQRRLFGGRTQPVPLAGQTVIVVDDGIATGATMRVALRALRTRSPQRLLVAIPVAPQDVLALLATEADEIVCLQAPSDLAAVAQFYDRFSPVADEDVMRLLVAK